MTLYGLVIICLFVMVFGGIGIKISVRNKRYHNHRCCACKHRNSNKGDNFVEKIEKFRF